MLTHPNVVPMVTRMHTTSSWGVDGGDAGIGGFVYGEEGVMNIFTRTLD
jgi:hypothetical protein